MYLYRRLMREINVIRYSIKTRRCGWKSVGVLGDMYSCRCLAWRVIKAERSEAFRVDFW